MKRLVVNAFCPGEHKVVSSHGTKTDLPPPGSPCYLMQNARNKDRVRGTNSVKRAVAQLGRAPGSGPGGRGFKSHQPDFNQLRLLAVAAATGPSFKSDQFDSTSALLSALTCARLIISSLRTLVATVL